MAVDVLVIHGAAEPRLRAGRVYWEPLLEASLGAGYRVHAPRMPRPDEPDYRAWARAIDRFIDERPNPVLVGHSLGASVLLKLMCEARSRPKHAGSFLVSTPFWGPELPDFALPDDFGSRLADLAPLFFYHSRDDREVPVQHVERYRRALPHATVRVLPRGGHELDLPTFPELAKDIAEVVSAPPPRR